MLNPKTSLKEKRSKKHINNTKNALSTSMLMMTLCRRFKNSSLPSVNQRNDCRNWSRRRYEHNDVIKFEFLCLDLIKPPWEASTRVHGHLWYVIYEGEKVKTFPRWKKMKFKGVVVWSPHSSIGTLECASLPCLSMLAASSWSHRFVLPRVVASWHVCTSTRTLPMLECSPSSCSSIDGQCLSVGSPHIWACWPIGYPISHISSRSEPVLKPNLDQIFMTP